MNFGSLGAAIARSESPALSSRAASPQLRVASQEHSDDPKVEKATRRYAAIIERTLATWEISPEEWADYIAFLSRLLKAVQSKPEIVSSLPYSSSIASRLAQCLNPNLPSGVHQKALEVYTYVFTTFGMEHVAEGLDDYLPGLFPLLAFASLSVRPALYELLEDHVTRLQVTQLRPILKSFILSLLPALEDETSEDFDRALGIVVRLEKNFCTDADGEVLDSASFFWQSIYLAIVSSPSRRQGALNYLTRRSMSFGTPIVLNSNAEDDEVQQEITAEAEAAVTPDPGLLIRAFSCGLSDSQTLVQRGFLDLLSTTLPLHSPVLQHRIGQDDLHMLLDAVLGILLRRDMSLNRRIWSWFLGPEAKDENGEVLVDTSQTSYFATYGMSNLQACLIRSFKSDLRRPQERARPFRISLSLMDRQEIGTQIISEIFLPAINNAYIYACTASRSDIAEVLKSVSLFFDAVESRLIWSSLFSMAQVTGADHVTDKLAMFMWVLKTFNVREEDMCITYAPLTMLYLLSLLASGQLEQAANVLQAILTLVGITSSRAFSLDVPGHQVQASHPSSTEVTQLIANFLVAGTRISTIPLVPDAVRGLCLSTSLAVMGRALRSDLDAQVTLSANILSAMVQKQGRRHVNLDGLVDTVETSIAEQGFAAISFERLTALVTLMTLADSSTTNNASSVHERLLDLEPAISNAVLTFVSPQNSEYSIDAVKLLWRIDSMFRSEEAVKSSIQAMLTCQTTTSSRLVAIRTFLNLWTLSAAVQPSSSKSPMVGLRRRPSGSVAIADAERSSRVMEVLKSSLSIVLDLLTDPDEAAVSDISLWLNYSHHAETIIQSLIESLDSVRTTSIIAENTRLLNRAMLEAGKTVSYTLGQINCVLKHAQLAFWISLSETQVSDTLPGPSGLASLVLAKHCLQLLPASQANTKALHGLALEVLSRLLDGPAFIHAQLQAIDMKGELVKHLVACFNDDMAHLQPSMLRALARALKMQPQEAVVKPDVPRHSVHVRRISVAAVTGGVNIPASTDTNRSAQALVQALRQGLSTPAVQPYLDAWLDFLADVLPTLGELLATNLIALTETLCAQSEHIFEQVMMSSTGVRLANQLFSPEATLVKMLDALEIMLRTAHDALLNNEVQNEVAEKDGPTSVLNSVTPNMFKQQGNPSKTARANSRLTVTLSAKDVVRICIRMYVWSCHAAEGNDTDRLRSGTTMHVALKLRNRSRHMLEGIFSIDMMETLEVVALNWSEASSHEAKTTIISLLHVLHTTRPKMTIPAILDALCSRTNPSILGADRVSSLSTDLSAGTLVLFYSAYLDSLEDDALDEVWSDCSAFMKDVLSNPLPYRSILPVLLWIAFQLAEKLDNTNFGEKKRMRRELGDNFQRLLTATFTTIPAGSLDISDERHNRETSFTHGLQDLNLLVILREIVARAEILLETGDRVATSINAITTYIVTPTLRGKTFPSRVSADVLALVVRIAKKLPSSKLWRKDVADAFNDVRFIVTPPAMVTRHWFPILQQLLLSDKERMPEILARLYAPTSAGIMFGVGANAARLDADRKTQLNLRRVALLCLASSTDGQVEHLKVISEKIVELFEATTVSSPSSVVKAELFLLFQALLLSISPTHIAALWPIININLKQALLSMSVEPAQSTSFNNLALLQACRLLDLLVAMSPEEFQLHEWVFVTNTTDAIYHASDWVPMAISDQLADALGTIQPGEEPAVPENEVHAPVRNNHRGPTLKAGIGFDTEDLKVMSRDVFISTTLRPFLSQLSIHLYESRYRLEKVETSLFRAALVADLQDAATIVT